MLALALILAAGHELEMPPSLMPAVAAASDAMLRVENCAGKSERASGAFDRRDLRYFRLSWSILQVWGAEIERDVAWAMSLQLHCDAKSRKEAIAGFDAAIGHAERIFEQAILPMRQGVWIGALRLCRDTVVRTEVAKNIADDQVLRVTLSSDASSRFAALTERIARHHGGGQIAFRVNGRLLSEIGVHERIEGGVIDLPAPFPSRPDFPALAEPLAAPC